MEPARLPPFAGAVLTGGASRRMGTDKALLAVRGRPMAAVAVAALEGAGAAPVRAVGGDRQRLTARGIEAMADDHPGQGPLGGILTALRWSPHELVVVLACDLPAIGPAEVTAIVTALAARPDALVAAPTVGGRPQFLTAAYRREARGGLLAAFAGGQRAVRGAVAAAGLPVVPTGPLDAGRLADADTPADLVRLEVGAPVVRAARPRGHARVPEPGRDSIAGVEERPAVPEVDVHTAARRRAAGAALVDVREPDEHEEIRAPGVVLVPLGDVPSRVGELPRDRPLLLICRSGARSLRAAQYLAERGFDVVNVAGGMIAWAEAGLPVERGR